VSKSAGNPVFVHDLLERSGPAALRLLVVNQCWRDRWEFEETDLDQAG